MEKELDIEQLDKISNRVLRSILARLKKFGNGKIILSRYEFAKYRSTEYKMRSMLAIIRKNGFYVTGGEISHNYNKTNTHTVSEKLLKYIYSRLNVSAGSFDIVNFCNTCSAENALDLLGTILTKKTRRYKNITVFKNSEYKYKYNRDKNIITRYSKTGKDTKWFNLFNGMKELFGYSTRELINKLA